MHKAARCSVFYRAALFVFKSVSTVTVGSTALLFEKGAPRIVIVYYLGGTLWKVAWITQVVYELPESSVSRRDWFVS